MTVFIDPSEGVLKLLTRRTSLVRKMAAARSMDNAEFRILYNNRVRLLRSKWDDSADPETIDAEIDEATERLHGAIPLNEDYALWAEEVDWIEFRLMDFRTDKKGKRWYRRLFHLPPMHTYIKMTLIASAAIIVSTSIWVYFSPYQSCVRSSFATDVEFMCARAVGGKR